MQLQLRACQKEALSANAAIFFARLGAKRGYCSFGGHVRQSCTTCSTFCNFWSGEGAVACTTYERWHLYFS